MCQGKDPSARHHCSRIVMNRAVLGEKSAERLASLSLSKPLNVIELQSAQTFSGSGQSKFDFLGELF